MSALANNGDSDFIEARRLPVRVSRYWDFWPADRCAAMLNECRSVDNYCSDYLELADLLDRWPRKPWADLPADVRAELDANFGITTRGARELVRAAPAPMRAALCRRLGINLGGKRRRPRDR